MQCTSVRDGDPGALLTTMLHCEQGEIGLVGDLTVEPVDADHAAGLIDLGLADE